MKRYLQLISSHYTKKQKQTEKVDKSSTSEQKCLYFFLSTGFSNVYLGDIFPKWMKNEENCIKFHSTAIYKFPLQAR